MLGRSAHNCDYLTTLQRDDSQGCAAVGGDENLGVTRATHCLRRRQHRKHRNGLSDQDCARGRGTGLSRRGVQDDPVRRPGEYVDVVAGVNQARDTRVGEHRRRHLTRRQSVRQSGSDEACRGNRFAFAQRPGQPTSDQPTGLARSARRHQFARPGHGGEVVSGERGPDGEVTRGDDDGSCARYLTLLACRGSVRGNSAGRCEQEAGECRQPARPTIQPTEQVGERVGHDRNVRNAEPLPGGQAGGCGRHAVMWITVWVDGGQAEAAAALAFEPEDEPFDDLPEEESEDEDDFDDFDESEEPVEESLDAAAGFDVDFSGLADESEPDFDESEPDESDFDESFLPASARLSVR